MYDVLVVRALLFTALFREARLFKRHRRCIIRPFITALNSSERIPSCATHLYQMTDLKLFARLYLGGRQVKCITNCTTERSRGNTFETSKVGVVVRVIYLIECEMAETLSIINLRRVNTPKSACGPLNIIFKTVRE